jgi:hypothetical protein
MRQMEEKIRLYFWGGTQLVWVVHTRESAVDVYVPGYDPFRFEMDHVLDGGDVVPGFILPVKEIFSV